MTQYTGRKLERFCKKWPAALSLAQKNMIERIWKKLQDQRNPKCKDENKWLFAG
jgi:hypothetical protein